MSENPPIDFETREDWQGTAPFGHYKASDFAISGPVIDERMLCGSFLFFPHDTARAWSAMVANIANPGTALIRDDRHRLLIGKILEYRRVLVSRAGNAEPDMDFTEFLSFVGKDAWQDMGGSDYIVAHENYFWSISDTKRAIGRLLDTARVSEFQRLLDAAGESVANPADLNDAISLLNEKSRSMLRSETTMLTPTAKVCVDEVDRKVTEEQAADEIPTAFRAFADHVGEYKRGQITLVGAPPGNGKTALAMQEIQCALTHGFVVDAFLMESSFQQFSDRWIMRNYAVSGGHFKRKSFTKDGLEAIHDGMALLQKFENQLYLAPMENYTVAGLEALIQARKANTGQPCDMIVIDHLDCLSIKREKGQSPYDAMKDAVLQLRSLAARENAAMLLLSQLSVDAIRNTVGQNNKFPTLDAFRGGTPTEAAKVVVILNKDKQAMLDGSAVVEQQIVICKANDGQTGYIRSLFLKPFAMHIEDTSSAGRQQFAKWLGALNFPMDYQRKDARK